MFYRNKPNQFLSGKDVFMQCPFSMSMLQIGEWGNQLIVRVFTTCLLMCCVLAIVDKRNFMPIDKGLLPISIGSIVFAIGTCWAGNCGYPLNPARDLGPRLFTAVAGWGLEPFSHRNYMWFWVPLVAPCVGAAMAYYIYTFFIQLHWEPVEDNEGDEVTVNDDEKKEKQSMDNSSFINEPEEIVNKKHLESMSTIPAKM